MAQDVVLDTLIYDLFYNQFDKHVTAEGGGDLAILIEFMQEWQKDNVRWVDATLKTTVSESEHNRQLISTWVKEWKEKAMTDLAPLAEIAVNAEAMAASVSVLDSRLAKAGL